VVEVVSLRMGEPKGDAWVLVKKEGDQYLVEGKVNGKSMDASVAPRGFNTPAVAIRAATAWADLLTIPVIYVRED
jgi:hypothetical protein